MVPHQITNNLCISYEPFQKVNYVKFLYFAYQLFLFYKCALHLQKYCTFVDAQIYHWTQFSPLFASTRIIH